MKKLLFFFNLCFFLSLGATQPYYIWADIDFSPYSGSENILTLHQSLQLGSDKIFKIKKEKKVLGILKRFSSMVLVWLPLSEFEIVVQHEVFGHGYRVRDIGSNIAKVKKYEIDVPFPYGDGGGTTIYNFNSDLTSFGETSISAAGVEATAVLANRLKMKWMSDLKLDPRKLFLYLEGQQDLTSYVYSMDDSIFASEGHDIESYLLWLNNTYYQDHLSKSDIKKAVLINLCDPTTYLCIGSFFYYIFCGKNMKIPTIHIKNLKILPNLRLGLAPYGLEYYLENFMSYNNGPIYSYFKVGKHESKTFWGLGLEYPNLFTYNLYKIGFRCDFYRQPKIYFKEGFFIHENIQVGYSEKDLKKMIFGVCSSLILDKKFSKKSKGSLYIEGGYKTNGFVPGQSLRNSLIFRLGLGFDLL